MASPDDEVGEFRLDVRGIEEGAEGVVPGEERAGQEPPVEAGPVPAGLVPDSAPVSVPTPG
jgi:hypothetical protein